MLNFIINLPRRLVGYPLVIFGFVIALIGATMSRLGAWLLAAELLTYSQDDDISDEELIQIFKEYDMARRAKTKDEDEEDNNG